MQTALPRWRDSRPSPAPGQRRAVGLRAAHVTLSLVGLIAATALACLLLSATGQLASGGSQPGIARQQHRCRRMLLGSALGTSIARAMAASLDPHHWLQCFAMVDTAAVFGMGNRLQPTIIADGCSCAGEAVRGCRYLLAGQTRSLRQTPTDPGNAGGGGTSGELHIVQMPQQWRTTDCLPAWQDLCMSVRRCVAAVVPLRLHGRWCAAAAGVAAH